MSQNSLNIYLTKNNNFIPTVSNPNVFVYNENGLKNNAKWIKKNIEQNDCNYVIYDHNSCIYSVAKKYLLEQDYYIENITFKEKVNISINPFDCIRDISDIHFMFLSFLHILWDENDDDIAAMSNLVDAFANCVYTMFANQPEKLTMATLKKMVYSVRAVCAGENGTVSMIDAIFANIKDHESMAFKYYNQFLLASGDRKDEVAEKLAQAFDNLTDIEVEMMSKTDQSVITSFKPKFKTAFFLNASNEKEEQSSKLLLTMLNYCMQKTQTDNRVLFIIDNLQAKNKLISLPQWLQNATDYGANYIIFSDDLAKFKEDEIKTQYFRNIQQSIGASVLIHRNESVIKYQNKLPATQEEMCEYAAIQQLATVIIGETVSKDDVLF